VFIAKLNYAARVAIFNVKALLAPVLRSTFFILTHRYRRNDTLQYTYIAGILFS